MFFKITFFYFLFLLLQRGLHNQQQVDYNYYKDEQ